MDPLDPIEAAKKRTGHRWLDFFTTGSAILIAVISLVMAIRQSQIMEKQLAASVWPYLQYGTSNQSDDGKAVISFDVENAGVGPARVHAMSMSFNDKPIHNLHELVDACCLDLTESNGRPAWWTSTLHDGVLSPNRTKHFAMLIDLPRNTPYWQRLNIERNKVVVRICYCSVLDQCWMLDSAKIDNEPIAECPGPSVDDFAD